VGPAWRRQALSGPVWPSMVSDGAIGTSPDSLGKQALV